MTDHSETLRDLTLMLIYLTSWREKPEYAPRAWKGYDFGVLDELEEMELVSGSKRAKSVYMSEEGEQRAKELLAKYGIDEP